MIQLRTLGATDLRGCEGEEVRAVLAQPKRLALLAYLAIVRPRGFHQKDTLRALFWPEADDHHARLALNRAVYFLRHALGQPVILSGPGDTLGVAPEALWCDAVAFEDALDAGRAEEALELYRGDLLDGFFAAAAPEFEHWHDAARTALRLRAADAAGDLAGRARRAGDLTLALRCARRAAALSPYDERALGRLLDLLDRTGDRALAVRAYDEFAGRLRADLDVEPSPETRSLAEAIRARALPHRATPTGAPALAESRSQTRPSEQRHRRGPVVAGVVLLLFASMWGLWRLRALSAPATSAIRVAVIPFTNVNPEGMEYLNVGLTEELVTRLSKVPRMTVIAPVSASRTAERATADVRAFAAELGLHAVLRGSITQSNGRVRIAARLLDPRTEETLWAETFDRELRDILDVQGDIARRIAEALALEAGGEAATRLARRAPRSPEAYVSYLKGRYFLNKRTDEALNRAIAYFEDAVARDSGYALGYAGLADAHGLSNAYGGAQSLATGKAFALRAVELDSSLPEARLSLGFFRHMQEWDWDGAAREYERAIRLDPQHATARQWYALLLRDLGRLDDAALELRRGLELDPLSPAVSRNLGYVLFSAGRHQEAIEHLQRALELDPDFPLAREWLRNVYADAGSYDRAFEEQVEVAARQSWTPDALRALRDAYESQGWPGVLERLLTRAVEASHRRYISPAVLAARHAQLGYPDEAFRFLEQACRERDPGVLNIKTNPLYRSLRTDPRFTALVHRMGLPP